MPNREGTSAAEVRRLVSFSLRGFAELPDVLAQRFPVSPTFVGRVGERIKPDRHTVWRKNVLLYERKVGDNRAWDDAISSLLNELGGVEQITAAITSAKPEFVTVDMLVPARTSEEQEDGHLDRQTISLLSAIRASLSLSFC